MNAVNGVKPTEQAVLVRFPLSNESFGLAWELEVLGGLRDELADVIREMEAGELDGTEVGQGEFAIFLYGPDADELFEVVEPVLSGLSWPKVTAIKRYGAGGT